MINTQDEDRAQASYELSQKLPLEVVIAQTKALRRDIDELIQRTKKLPAGRENSVAITKLQEGVMWLGMALKVIADNNPGVLANPYPNSKDPGTLTIAPTADGLKL